MTLDKEPMKVSTTLRIAKQYYPQDKLEHALRVATYVSENTFIPYDLRDECCQRFKKYNTNDYLCAYWVKLADMKDYLSLTNTLTDRLKEKYLSRLRYLL